MQNRLVFIKTSTSSAIGLDMQRLNGSLVVAKSSSEDAPKPGRSTVSIELSSSMEAWGKQGLKGEGTSKVTTVASTEPVVIILQEFSSDVARPLAPPPKKKVDIVGPSALPPRNVS